MLEKARNLRKNSTEVEKRLWHFLKDRRLKGYKFNRQKIIGPYIVDFVCREFKLVIELDGGQHLENQLYDDNRTRFLNKEGYKVLRFWNDEVFKQIDAILMIILNSLEPPHPNLLPGVPGRGD